MQLSLVAAVTSLAPEQRKFVYKALANDVIEGWTPTVESVALLCESVGGAISFDEYRNRVLARLAPGSNHLSKSTNYGDAVTKKSRTARRTSGSHCTCVKDSLTLRRNHRGPRTGAVCDRLLG
jgi:hypothetical protein